MRNKLVQRGSNLKLPEVKRITEERRPEVRRRNVESNFTEFSRRVGAIAPDEEFRVKDVMNDVWDEHSDGTRRSIGHRVKKAVEAGEVDIEVSRKENNGTYYKRKLMSPFSIEE